MFFQFSSYIHWPLIIIHLYVLCVCLCVHKIYIGAYVCVGLFFKYVQTSCSTFNIQLHSIDTHT